MAWSLDSGWLIHFWVSAVNIFRWRLVLGHARHVAQRVEVGWLPFAQWSVMDGSKRQPALYNISICKLWFVFDALRFIIGRLQVLVVGGRSSATGGGR